MPFKVTATNAMGAISQELPTAQDALKKVLSYEAQGFQKIEVRDNAGRLLTRDQLAMLSIQQGS